MLDAILDWLLVALTVAITIPLGVVVVLGLGMFAAWVADRMADR